MPWPALLESSASPLASSISSHGGVIWGRNEFVSCALAECPHNLPHGRFDSGLRGGYAVTAVRTSTEAE